MFTLGYPAAERSPGTWKELDSLQNEFERIFSSMFPTHAAEYPATNVEVTDSGAVLEAELPGVKADNLEIEVVHDTITLKGRIEKEAEENASRYIRRERGYGEFARSISFPFRLDPEKVSARLENGILRIELKRPEEEQPRRITIEKK